MGGTRLLHEGRDQTCSQSSSDVCRISDGVINADFALMDRTGL
jgi:hypothetical protein